MQTTMLHFPYNMPCTPFMDMSEGMTSPSETPSPPATSYVSRFYDTMFVSSQPIQRRVPEMQHSNTASFMGSNPGFCKQNVSKNKSFSIEAILGIGKYEDTNRGYVRGNREFPGAIRLRDQRKQDRMMSQTSYQVPSATPRSSLTAVSPFFGSSSSTESSPMKDSLIPSLSTNLVKEPITHADSSRRNHSPTSSKPTNITPGPLSGGSKASGSSGKAKRIRTIFTPEQLERMETEFEHQQYMVGPERQRLAAQLRLTEAQVKVWFQNRRIKWRKQHLELNQARLAQLREEEAAAARAEDSDADRESLSPQQMERR